VSRAPWGKTKKGGGEIGTEDEHTNIHTHGKGTGEDKQGLDPLSLSLSRSRSLLLALSRPRSLATLVTPTTSTPVQDNTRPIPPLVFHPAPTHLGRGTQRQFYSSVQGPPGLKRRHLVQIKYENMKLHQLKELLIIKRYTNRHDMQYFKPRFLRS
jgi:hypothetical protein